MQERKKELPIYRPYGGFEQANVAQSNEDFSQQI